MHVPPRIRDQSDAILAIVLSVLFQAQVWLGVGLSVDEVVSGAGPAGQPVVAMAGLAFTMSLAWRRRWPLLPMLLAVPVLLLSGPGGVDGLPSLVLALVVTTWSVGTGTRDVGAIVGALGVAALVSIAVGRDPDAEGSLGDVLVPVLVIGGPWAAGLLARVRQEQLSALETRTAAIERDNEAATRAVVATERARISRELHDVVAHAISVIVVQSRGARHALDTDPAAVADSLGAIESTAVEALAEMRRLLDVLDDPTRSDGLALAPQPGLRDLDRLIATVREAGLPVELVIEGRPRRLPAGVDLSAYRIVQEALTNALRHAGPAEARVVVRYGVPGDAAIEIEVADTGLGDRRAGNPSADGGTLDGATGRGLIGMQERAALVGGVVDAGPAGTSTPGFVVRARLPVGEARP
jgi:signal transduction histidine kinase